MRRAMDFLIEHSMAIGFIVFAVVSVVCLIVVGWR